MAQSSSQESQKCFRCIGTAGSLVLPLLQAPTEEATKYDPEVRTSPNKATSKTTTSTPTAVGTRVPFESGVGLYLQIDEDECFCANFPCYPSGEFYREWRPDDPSHSDYAHIREMTRELLNADVSTEWDQLKYIDTLVITNDKQKNGSNATIDGILDWAGYEDPKNGRPRHVYVGPQTSFIVKEPGEDKNGPEGLVRFEGVKNPQGWRASMIAGRNTEWIYQES